MDSMKFDERASLIAHVVFAVELFIIAVLFIVAFGTT